MRHALLALVALVALAPPAGAESLAELLTAVAANDRFETPARADVTIEPAGGAAPARAVFLGRGDALYVEVKDGLRALVRGSEIAVAGGATAADAPSRALPGGNVLLGDLAVFRVTSLRFPQISDDGPAGAVVTGAPAGPSPYALLVRTIDRERSTVVKTQYYTGSVSNLAKIRRDRGFVRVAGHWRPETIEVESLREGTRTKLALAWREAPDAPAALFEPPGLGSPSGLTWP